MNSALETGALAPVTSTVPKPWEESPTFHDHLYDWMRRAPWLAISAAAHLLVFFVLMTIPWSSFRQVEQHVIEVNPERPPEDPFDEPEPEPEPPIDDVEPTDEPVLVDTDQEPLSEPTDELDVPDGEPDQIAFAPFEMFADNSILGIGGDAGGKYGNRGLGGPGGRGRGGRPTEQALLRGLAWLAAHQSPDGSWDADGFSANCGSLGSSTCDGPGGPTHDVGLTGLSLLAFLGAGSSTVGGAYAEVVTRGVVWLRKQQDLDSGLIGARTGHDFLYDHSLATLALCEAYYFSKSPLLKPTAQRAVDFIHHARNPYAAWRYDAPPIGDNDTSITGWMLFALAAAKDAGLKVDPAALEGGLSWIDEVSDPSTGRVGYDSFGSLSSRTVANEHYPREKGEAMTAVGLLCRIFLGQTPKEYPILEKHADLLRRTPPVWDPEGFGCDAYYWYYGTYAMFQMGGSHWKAWKRALEPAVLTSQRTDGDATGSWDPVGPWGHAGGRVYSTALLTLVLEVNFRYSRALGAR